MRGVQHWRQRHAAHLRGGHFDAPVTRCADRARARRLRTRPRSASRRARGLEAYDGQRDAPRSLRDAGARGLRRHRGPPRRARSRSSRPAARRPSCARDGVDADAQDATRRRSAAAQFDALAQPTDGSYDVYRPVLRRHLRRHDDPRRRHAAARRSTRSCSPLAAAQPGPRQAGRRSATRSTASRSSRSRSPSDARSTPRRQPPGGALQLHPARARVDHAGDRTAASRTCSSTTTRARDPRQDTTGRHRPAGATRAITSSSTTHELWFVAVANPDGYDYTFTPGNRLWRKNLRDNNGDGQITHGRRRRPEPQLPDQVGLRQRGLLARSVDRDLPRQRARLRARDAGDRRPAAARSASSSRSTTTRPRSCCSTRSAARSRRYTADDPIYRALSGTDDDPAIDGPGPGAPDDYDPDVSRRALHHQRRDHRPRARAVRHAGVDARDGRRRPGARRRRQRLRVPGLRGRRRRTRSRRTSRSRSTWRSRPSDPDEPGLAPREHGAGLRVARRSRSPTATRRRCEVNAKRELGAGRAALHGQRRARAHGAARASGTAASATATPATSTTTACAARCAAPSRATRSRSGSRPAARSARSPFTYTRHERQRQRRC